MIWLWQEIVIPLVLVVASWFLGGMPWGLWIGKKAKGEDFDIRDWGSGNIGATNAIKILGWWGLLVFVADTAKGFLPVFAGRLLGLNEWWLATLLLAPGIGHFRSIWMYWYDGKFSGGKSVATFWGGTLGLSFLMGSVLLAGWIIAVPITGYVSVASLLAVIAAFGLTWAFHLPPIFKVIYGIVWAIVTKGHDRNIGRLIQGTEPRWNDKRGAHNLLSNKRVSSFGTHPLREIDLDQSRLSSWLYKLLESGRITKKTLRKLIAKYGKVMEYDQITGIVSKTGLEGLVLLKGVPLLPDQLLTAKPNPRKPEMYNPVMEALLADLLMAGAVLSQRGGADDFGLGALLSSVSPNGGEELQQRCRERGLTVAIDNGAAFTVGSNAEVIRRTAPKPLKECILANVGASGIIGKGTISYMRHEIGEIWAFAPDTRKLEDVEEFARTFPATEEFAKIGEADIVVFNTNAGNLLTAENAHLLKPGAVVIDVSVPEDVKDEILKVRPDVQLYRSGLIRLPGKPQMRTDIHFGYVEEGGVQIPLVPACLAQGLLMAFENDFSHASRGGRIRDEDVNFFLAAAEKHGFKIVCTRVSEGTLFSGISADKN